MKNGSNLKACLALFIFLAFGYTGLAQTPGTLTFALTTTSSGGYSPKNVTAIWIQNSSNAFVKTKLKMCSSSNLDHLGTWTSISGQNVVDATTGATRTTHGTITVTWNGTNASGAVVPDGSYTIWIEMAWASSLTTGKVTTSFPFTKGSAAFSSTPASTTNFSGISLNWTPAVLPEIGSPVITGDPSCAGNPITLHFSLGTGFNTGNVFTAQLSSPTGSFASPTPIGTSTVGGSVAAVIPAGTAAGTAYRIRIVSSDPVVTGPDNGADLTIQPQITPGVSLTANPSGTVCPGTPIEFTASPVNGGTPAFQWLLNGNPVGTNSPTFTVTNPLNSDQITCVMTSTATCLSQPTATSAPYQTALFSTSPVTLTETGGVISCSATSGIQWYEVNGGILWGATSQNFTPLNTGDFYCLVTDGNGCTVNSDTLHITVNGLVDSPIHQNVRVLRNPMVDELELEWTGLGAQVNMCIRSLEGKTLFVSTLPSNGNQRVRLKPGPLDPGLYLLSVTSDHFQFHQKIMVVR